MKTYFVRAALACAALAIMTAAAMAAVEPIPGVDVVVHCHCFGKPMMYTTSGDGTISVRNLAPGEYEVEIVGKSLIAAMDKLAPPEKKSGGGFSLGIGGGMFGGGSSHSSSGHPGAGPVGGGAGGAGGYADGHLINQESYRNRSGHGVSGGSGGVGVGVGMNIPVGGDGNGSPQSMANPITLRAEIGWDRHDAVGVALASKVSVDVPYCRDTAGQGMRIRFTIPEGGGDASVAIFDNTNETGMY